MKMIRTGALSLIAGLVLPISAHAQSQTLSASPIPDDAENRFCYYAGLVYSKQSYIVIAGDNTVTSKSVETQQRLLECVSGDDGSLHWVARSKIQTGKLD